MVHRALGYHPEALRSSIGWMILPCLGHAAVKLLALKSTGIGLDNGPCPASS